MNQTVRAVTAGLLIGLGLVLIAAGTAGLARLWELMLADGGYALLASGAFAVLFAVLPRGLRIGPALLMGTGLVFLVNRHHSEWYQHRSELAGAAMIVGGVWLSAMKLQWNASTVQPVIRVFRVLVPRRLKLGAGDTLPGAISVMNVGTLVDINLLAEPEPEALFVEILVSSWAGVTMVRVPPAWPVVAGRVDTAVGVKFDGDLSIDEAVADPQGAAGNRVVENLLAKNGGAGCVVVLHVTGVGGLMAVRRN